MAVLIASDLGKDVAGAPLFRGVSFKLERRERLTLAGRNGSGKTTLLRVLAGEASHDAGELAFAKGVRVALHDQRPPRDRDLSLRDYVLSGSAELLDLEAELARLEDAMAGGAHDEGTMNAYADAQARLEARGGYGWRERASAVLHGLGFGDADLDRPLRTFSGGELTRGSLARALAAEPDLLLLDEPTNHLDIESLEWLEGRLQAFPGAVVLVAHDRWFLEAVGTAVLELEGAGRDDGARGRFFAGPWHTWREEKAQRELALGRAVERQQAEIQRLERFVTRFRAGTRARQAQARQKRLDRMERVGAGAKDARGLAFGFDRPERAGRVIFELEGGRVEIAGRTLVAQADFWLERGEKVVLVGPNGSGKSTLVRVLTGEHELAAGKLRRGHNVTLGLLAQHTERLGTDGTVVEACQRATGLTPNKARALLGRFLFSGEDAEKPLAGLSGGERQRLALAILVSGGANVLVLDEPTNHLDVESREALEDALTAFEGTVLLVSHDRALLAAVGSRTVAVEDGTLHSYLGGWEAYLALRKGREEAGRANGAGLPAPAPAPAPSSAAAKPAKATARRERKPAGGPSKNRQKRQRELETAIERAEAALAALEDDLADPARWASAHETEKSRARHTAAKRAVDEAYAALEAFEAEAPS